MEIPEQDAAHMARAVELAARGHGTTSPNPVVGCVVLDAAGAVAGEGFHAYAGGPHAEVVALSQAGERARGGTAYVTLEPCDHTGRTGPCSRALLDAGIARVVVAVADPSPKAAGGAARLRAAGVAVTMGVLSAAAERVNEEWLTYARLGRSHVTWKFAATLDGRSAAEDGTSQWITSAEARADVHRLRAAADAIVAGIGTVLADDPRLTARPAPAPWPGSVARSSLDGDRDGSTRSDTAVAAAPGAAARVGAGGAGEADTVRAAPPAETGAAGVGASSPRGTDAAQALNAGRVVGAGGGANGRVPLRVVVDTEARTPPGARVLDDEAPTLIAVAEGVGTELKADLLRLPRHGDGLDLHALLRELAAREVVSVFLEGGPTLAGSFLRQGLVDRVVAYVAPALLGSGRSALGAAGVGTIGRMHRLTFDEISPIGPDVRLIARPIAHPCREQ
ncbi:bifunctional diaminohydroxyphosphoribosylaminopyrimidine deaminase/5-amino-6-(5-phosphoribosylamino)uracil reductase RibD [Nonomuraea sp. SYSU D8015]|uniref:bifunctional diaminohydroxyphosphoribosylaminopyrimidine deaminase/5-amino-6-(5-phosphoribosylamino)uracil reductase RibD n=1 Tax=Nonomuraea sp. SYSU D8015 TaxID=2593644 RepID=UPI001CB6EB20|nr:bifunctional diaminohydroxyphosphoribosylaminopyrimidine deaminase/5-amino-6-(5-phosphoribosylamino)uracil reductase RibD [Nonomuraea sp. SYSU D8015]